MNDIAAPHDLLPGQSQPEKLTVAEFRKNLKMALDYCVQGGIIEIERMGQRFILMQASENMGLLSNRATPKKIEPPKVEGSPLTPACCKGKSPCKHWYWDGIADEWVNSISDEHKSPLDWDSSTPAENPPTSPKVTLRPQIKSTPKVYAFCKHNQIRGLCKKGCK